MQYENTGYFLNIMIMFDRSHLSWAAMKPNKYDHNSLYISHALAKHQFSLTEKSMNKALISYSGHTHTNHP